MPKKILLLVLLLLTSLASAQDLSKPVTYRTVAVPLRQALEQISQQAGVKLTVSEELGSEPIILSLRGATTQAAMDHIASAIGAKWTDEGKGEYLLERTPAMAEKLEQEAVAERAEVIKKSIERLSSDMAKDKGTPEEIEKNIAGSFASEMKRYEQGSGNGRETRAVMEHMPAHRALVRLLKLMNPRELALLQDGEKAVYSSHPTTMQKPLPEGVDQVADQLQIEQNIFADEFSKEHPRTLTASQRGYQRGVAQMASRPAKLLLLAGVDFGVRSATLIAIDSDGNSVACAGDALRVDPMNTLRAKNEAVVAGEKNDADIPISPESKLLSLACEAATNVIGNPPPLGPEVRRLVLRPVAHDPMSFLVSDGFLAVADRSHSNLIAYPSDEMVFVNYSLSDVGGFKLPSFLQGLDDEGMEVSIDKDWAVAEPQDRVSAWKTRTDREAYEKCLQEADSRGYISIPTAAELALTVRSASEPKVPGAMGLLGQRYNPFFGRDIHVLRFYASLSSGQVSYLLGGGKLSAGEMSQEQWSLLQQLAYQGGGQLVVTGPDVSDDEYGDLGTYVLVREPTEFMPNGLSPDASVTLTSKNTDLIFADTKSEDGWEWLSDLSIDQIASTIAADESKPGGKSTILWLGPGASHDLTLTFDLTPKRRRVANMREIVRSDTRWTLDKLPPDLKKKLDAAVVKAKAELDKTPDTTPLPVAQPPL